MRGQVALTETEWEGAAPLECQGCSVCAVDTAGADDQSGASPDLVLRSLPQEWLRQQTRGLVGRQGRELDQQRQKPKLP